ASSDSNTRRESREPNATHRPGVLSSARARAPKCRAYSMLTRSMPVASLPPKAHAARRVMSIIMANRGLALRLFGDVDGGRDRVQGRGEQVQELLQLGARRVGHVDDVLVVHRKGTRGHEGHRIEQVQLV